MRRNGRTTWKVRPTPAAQIRCGGWPVISRPSKTMLPAAGRRKPLSALKSVVLPAPFGPMIPRISPVATRRLTPSSAFRPPNAIDTPDTSSSVAPMVRADAGASSATIAAGATFAFAADARRCRRSRSFQTTPSGASRITAMIATPYTTPWIPGISLPSRAWSSSDSGTSTTAPITGPHTVPTPPNIATISACDDTSIPKTACGVTTSSTTA